MAKDLKKNKKPARRKVDFKAVFAKIGRYFKEVVGELKKVTWPTRKDLVSYTTVVVVFIIIMAAIIFVMDLGLDALLKLAVGS